MENEDSVSQTFDRIREWNEWGRRLTDILQEAKERTGEPPLCITEEGKAFVPPDVLQKLNEPGNEGPLEFLKYMKQMSIPEDLKE